MERGDLLGKNIRALKKIDEALKMIDSPFTSTDMAKLTGLEVKRTEGLLRQFENIERIPVSYRRDICRVVFKVI